MPSAVRVDSAKGTKRSKHRGYIDDHQGCDAVSDSRKVKVPPCSTRPCTTHREGATNDEGPDDYHHAFAVEAAAAVAAAATTA